jgi:hypothetical protein
VQSSVKVSKQEFYNWTLEQHQNKKCFCGKFACIGFNYRYGMLELLCFKHYEERKNQCPKEKVLMEVKKADRQRSLL